MIEACNKCMEEENISCEMWGDRCIVYLAQAIAGITRIPIDDCPLRKIKKEEKKASKVD